jgi:hypothetical protein
MKGHKPKIKVESWIKFDWFDSTAGAEEVHRTKIGRDLSCVKQFRFIQHIQHVHMFSTHISGLQNDS